MGLEKSFNNFSLELQMVGVSKPLEHSNALAVNDIDFTVDTANISDSLLPKPEDFIKVPFRFLSAGVVGVSSWKAADFSDAAVLRASMHKLIGKPIYTNHEHYVENWAGVIDSVWWSEATTQVTPDGVINVPAGIDGIVLVDGKANPKLVRGLLIGAIYSVSVVVVFDWKPSHEFANENELLDNIGNTGEDGKLVRRIATNIYDYYELSFVFLGADPYAKLRMPDNTLKHPDKSMVYVPFNKDIKECNEYKTNKKFYIPYCLTKDLLSLSQGTSIKNIKKTEMEDFIAKFKSVLNIDEAKLKTLLGLSVADQITKEAFNKHFIEKNVIDAKSVSHNSLAEGLLAMESAKTIFPDKENINPAILSSVCLVKKEDYLALQGNVETLKQSKEDNEKLKQEVVKLEATASFGLQAIKANRTEVKRLYSLSVDTPDVAILSLIDSAEMAALDGMLKQYTKLASTKFSGKCKDCGSTSFEFKSSVATEPKQTFTNEVVSAQDLHAKYASSSMNLLKK